MNICVSGEKMVFEKLLNFFGLKNEDHWILIIFTNLFGLIFLIGLIAYSLKYSCVNLIFPCDNFLYVYKISFCSCNTQYENLIIVMFGLLVGWFLAMLFSPYSKKDETAFSIIFKGVSIFFSGYLVNELSKYSIDLNFFLKKQNLMLTFLFLASILLSWLVVFSNRIYMNDRNMIAKLEIDIDNYKAKIKELEEK